MCMLLKHVSSEQEWHITKKSSGQPIAISQLGDQPYDISISHSKEYIACAASTSGPIGIDIEFHKPRNFEKLAKFGFGPKEQEAIRLNGKDAFYKTWVLREACTKMHEKSILSTLHGNDNITASTEANCWGEKEANFYYKKIAKDFSLGIASLPSSTWDKSDLSEIKIRTGL